MRLRHYETVYIVRTDVGDDVTTKLRDRMKEIVEAHSGREIKHETWGKRKLAYEIDKNGKGVYQYTQYLADNKCVAEMQRNLRISDAVLKFMTVLLGVDMDPETFDYEAVRAKGLSLQTKGGDSERRGGRDRGRPGGRYEGFGGRSDEESDEEESLDLDTEETAD